MTVREKFENIENIVIYALRKFPKTRGNDIELIRRVWALQGFRIPKKFLPFFYKVAHPETITRSRRKLQGEGLYLPKQPRISQRTLADMEHRDFFRPRGIAEGERG